MIRSSVGLRCLVAVNGSRRLLVVVVVDQGLDQTLLVEGEGHGVCDGTMRPSPQDQPHLRHPLIEESMLDILQQIRSTRTIGIVVLVIVEREGGLRLIPVVVGNGVAVGETCRQQVPQPDRIFFQLPACHQRSRMLFLAALIASVALCFLGPRALQCKHRSQ